MFYKTRRAILVGKDNYFDITGSNIANKKTPYGVQNLADELVMDDVLLEEELGNVKKHFGTRSHST
jgi:hypothetical protein